MLKTILKGRLVLPLLVASVLLAVIVTGCCLLLLPLKTLRGSIEEIGRFGEISARARATLEAVEDSQSSVATIHLGRSPVQRQEHLEKATQQITALEPSVRELRSVSAGFITEPQSAILSGSVATISGLLEELSALESEKFPTHGQIPQYSDFQKHFRDAKRVLVSLQRDAGERAEAATKNSFDGIESAALLLVLTISGAGLIGFIALFSNYCFAQTMRNANEELRQKNAEIKERDRISATQNQRFDAALNNMSHGLCMFDAQQRLIVCNERYASLYGLSRELVKPGTMFREILQHRVDGEVFPDGSPEDYISERVAAVVEEETSTKVQTLRDGRVIAIFHQPLPGGGWVATHEDITELKKAEEAFRESEELFSKAFHASPAACAISSPDDGRIFDVNESWIEIFGFSRQEVITKTVRELGIWFNPDDRSRFVERVAKEGSARALETKFRNKSGAELDVLLSGEYFEVAGEPRLFVVAHDITERKRAEKALIEESRRFNIALENMPQGLAMFDSDQRLIVSNERYMTIYGLPPDLVKPGVTLREILQNRIDRGTYEGSDPQSYMKEVLDWTACGVRSKRVHMMSDGRAVEVLHQPMSGGGWLTTHHDITDRIQAEDALRDSEELFSKAFQASPAAFAISNPDDGTYYDVNEAWINVLGYSREEAMAGSSVKLGVWADPDARTRFIDQLKKEGLVRAYEAKFRTKRGAELDVLVSGEFVDIGGEPRALMVAHDITERKGSEKALRDSEQRFRDIVETASDWIWECDADLTITFLSERYTEVTGLPARGVIGRTWQEISNSRGSRADPGSDWGMHLKGLEARQPFRDFRYNITNPSGDILHFTISGTPVFDDSGAFAGYRGTGGDTTAKMRSQVELIRHRDHLQEMVGSATADLKAKADELKRALAREKLLNEQQRQFISMASHEFRTPLAVIDGIVQRMIRRKDKLLPDELEVRANKIRGAVGTITTLMESTLTAARMDSGATRINVAAVDLRQVIKEICARQHIVDGNREVICDLDALPDTIVGDRAVLDQVFTNLLSNAVKYSPDDSEVTIKGWCEGKTVVMNVQDRGLGIDEDDLPKMFTRFFRAKTSTGIPGTGIGLNLVKTLVELHDGKITVQSQKGFGSTFTVQLPVEGPARTHLSGGRAA